MKESSVKEKTSGFSRDVLQGLSKTQKEIPSKYFYDERGSELFEQICGLDEYYPTGCEVEIMQHNLEEIADVLGGGVQLIELGSGSSMKTRLLLKQCKNLAMYVPVDISDDFLQEVGAGLRNEFPDHDIRPVVADYTSKFDLPENGQISKKVVYYPGSTIGNFTKRRAHKFLNSIGGNLSAGDGLLIGVDLKKDPDLLKKAYNDSEGVTAAFNKNLLARINRELGANFSIDRFKHVAFYNCEEGRIEMHLESLEGQSVTVAGQKFWFEKGETIHTENSHKYKIDEFEELAGDHFSRLKTWTDSRNYFSVHYFARV